LNSGPTGWIFYQTKIKKTEIISPVDSDNRVYMPKIFQREIERLKKEILVLSAIVEESVQNAVGQLPLAIPNWRKSDWRWIPKSTRWKSISKKAA